MRGSCLQIPGTPGQSRSLGFAWGGRRDVTESRSGRHTALSAHLYKGQPRRPGAGRSAPPPTPTPTPDTPHNVSLPPRAEANRLLQRKLFSKS